MSEYTCPHCHKPIYDNDALLCLYCGRSLNRDIGFMGKLKYSGPRKIIVVIALLVILGFILLIVL